MSKPFDFLLEGLSEEDKAEIEMEIMLDLRDECMPQVEALIDANWRFEELNEDTEPWEWAWRRPPRRKGIKGRLFRSTNQAYRALTKGRK